MMNNEALPLVVLPMTMQHEGMTIHYPQVFCLMEQDVQQSINETIFQTVQNLIETQCKRQDTESFAEMVGTFEIKTNERHVLSLTLTNYAIPLQAANGLTLIKGLTFDTTKGKMYTLGELFKQGSDYIDVLSRLVKEQIEARDIPVLEKFKGIEADQDFYIADKALVIFFQELEITAHYLGSPMFPISVFALDDIITENGPLGRMATNS